MNQKEYVEAVLRSDRGAALTGVRLILLSLDVTPEAARQMRATSLVSSLRELAPCTDNRDDIEALGSLADACEHWGIEWRDVDRDHTLS